MPSDISIEVTDKKSLTINGRDGGHLILTYDKITKKFIMEAGIDSQGVSMEVNYGSEVKQIADFMQSVKEEMSDGRS
jgi:hypothetical protein